MSKYMAKVVYRFSFEETLSANVIPRCNSWQVGLLKVKPT